MTERSAGIRALLGVGALVVLASLTGACGPKDHSEPASSGLVAETPSGRSPQTLKEQLPPLPPMDRLEAPVRRQFEERGRLLNAALDNPQVSPSDLAWALGQMGRLNQAYRHLNDALWFLTAAHEQDPESFEWAYLAGHLHKALGQFAEAEELLKRAAELRTDQAVVWVALGQVEAKLGRPGVGRERYRKALELDPRMVLARYELALLDLAEGHPADAAFALEKLLEEQPMAYQLHYALAEAMKKLGRPEDAEAQLRYVPESPTQRVGLRGRDPWQESIQDLPVSATALERKGRQALILGEMETAADFFRRAEESAPHRREIRFNLAMTYFSTGRFDQAEAKLEELVREFPDYSAPYRLWGRILASKGKDSKALSLLRRAVELDPKSETHRRALGTFYLHRGRVEQAREQFRRAVELDDRGSDGFLGLAQCLLLQDERAEAIRVVSEGLERQPRANGLRWLALRLRSVDPEGRFGSAFPSPPRTVFELESAAMSRAVEQDFENAIGLQKAALTLALKDRELTGSVSTEHLEAVRRRLKGYESGSATELVWVAGERPRFSTGRASGSPSRSR